MNATLSTSRPLGAGNRLLSGLLFVVMLVGGFVMWFAAPVAVLWILGEIVDTIGQHYLLALVAVPLAMLIVGIGLAFLNVLYLRVNGVRLEDADDEWIPRLRSPLDRILGVWAIIALVALLIWIFFGDHGPYQGIAW